MSKKNRNKFRNREANRPAPGSSPAASAVQAPVRAVSGGSSGAFAQHTAEYRIIGKDLIRLVILNAIMLVAVFALYYVNRSSGIVEKLFHQIFH